MKRRTWLLVAAGLLAAAACGIVAVRLSMKNGSVAQGGSSLQPGAAQAEMGATGRLALGVILLEDSADPLTADQAREMAVYWKALRNISSSDHPLDAEMTALVDQIEATFSTNQLGYLNEMEIDFSTIAAVAGKLGLQMGSGMGGFSTSQQPPVQASGGDTNFVPGAMGDAPPEGAPGMGEMGAIPDMGQRDSGTLPSAGGGLGLPDQLIEAIIGFLVERSNQ